MKKYQIIYADPPWMYNDRRNHKSTGMALSAYQCMEIDKIKHLPIKQIADKNCVLFLWTTFPKLKEGIEVLESWGFKYITVAFVWVKLNPTGKLIKENKDVICKKGIYSGLGHWTNANAEIVLLGKIGKPSRIIKNVKQVTIAPRGKHSVKPKEIGNKIVQLMGDLPRIELFAREKCKGWDIIEGKDNADGTGNDIIEWINKNTGEIDV